MTLRSFLALIASILFVATLPGEDAIAPEQLRFFESKIRPVLVEHCYQCHSVEKGKSKGGLLLDSRDALLRGGDAGVAMVPGVPDDSALLFAISYEDPDFQMPPKHRLSEATVADFRRWIEMGAPDPRTEAAVGFVEGGPIDIARGRDHWAYQAVARPTASMAGKQGHLIDAFVESVRKTANLQASPAADPNILLRRLSYDLTGLPPTPAEVDRFQRASREDPEQAIGQAVDEYLGSRAFGEHWGRHWLDVARYAESSGKESNVAYPHAWRYRDYVIDSLADDKPYDQFIREQIAGDLLPYEELAQQAEYLVATGFLAIGPKSMNEMKVRQFTADLVDEQIDAMSRAFLATSVACARCHDHKFDPIPTEDYYALAGIFSSTKTYFGTTSRVGAVRGGELLYLPDLPELHRPEEPLTDERGARLQDELATARVDFREITLAIAKARREGNQGNVNPLDFLRGRDNIARLEALLESYDDDGDPWAYAMGVWENDRVFDSPVFVRGEIEKPTEDRVPRGFVQVLCPPDTSSTVENRRQSGRLELAKWIASPEHPLTARVYVNRIWHHLFGAGLVPSVDNFGKTGDKPSHPELLDWLALRFVEQGWSTKKLIREIVLTETYQQASTHREDSFLKDPENRLLWRMSKKRLTGEQIRDGMLSVAGSLQGKPPKASEVARRSEETLIRTVMSGALERAAAVPVRSVYLPIVREQIPASLRVFDFAEASLVTGDRETTNVPSQALYLMNNPFVVTQSGIFAGRIYRQRESWYERLRFGFQLAYSRPPTTTEFAKLKEFFDKFRETALAEGKTQREAGSLALQSYCQALLGTAEFRMLD